MIWWENFVFEFTLYPYTKLQLHKFEVFILIFEFENFNSQSKLQYSEIAKRAPLVNAFDDGNVMSER